jgi:hypothetical protein
MEKRLQQIAEENQHVLRQGYARERNALVALLAAGALLLACLLVSSANSRADRQSRPQPGVTAKGAGGVPSHSGLLEKITRPGSVRSPV